MKTGYIFQSVLCLSAFLFLMTGCAPGGSGHAGETRILRWKEGKKAAVSLTFDDNTINQFRVALPIMEEMGFRGTFFINTGLIPGSEFQSRFIGRPVEEIIRETATIPTSPENLFERGSAVGFLGYEGLMEYHTRAGAAVDAGDMEKACRIIDEAYTRVRTGRVKKSRPEDAVPDTGRITWDELREFAVRGHEFASHTISHPRLAILDEANMLWELEKCREEILNQLGPQHTFSCECPFGTENERVMKYAFNIYPALRNRMPEEYMAELNRSSRTSPGEEDREYVQWQRGALSDTPLEVMASWIDTCLAHEDIWLVLVFHGIDGVGWEAIPGDTIRSFFRTIKSHEEDLWIATFRDVAKYMRERMQGEVEPVMEKGRISVVLTHSLDPALYDLPLTLYTVIPERWEHIRVSQGGRDLDFETGSDQSGKYIIYQAMPNQDPVIIAPAAK
jgi:peptidoglycan/xylan/chitin deacetylase (PgdA/CDA1 family)